VRFTFAYAFGASSRISSLESFPTETEDESHHAMDGQVH
jgi:hypothetical protein